MNRFLLKRYAFIFLLGSFLWQGSALFSASQEDRADFVTKKTKKRKRNPWQKHYHKAYKNHWRLINGGFDMLTLCLAFSLPLFICGGEPHVQTRRKQSFGLMGLIAILGFIFSTIIRFCLVFTLSTKSLPSKWYKKRTFWATFFVDATTLILGILIHKMVPPYVNYRHYALFSDQEDVVFLVTNCSGGILAVIAMLLRYGIYRFTPITRRR